MMIGTVYLVRETTAGLEVERRIEKVRDALTVEDFIRSCEDRFVRAPGVWGLEFGPIGEPWGFSKPTPSS